MSILISFDTCLFKMLRSIRKKKKNQRWAINDTTYFCSRKTMGMMFAESECVCICTYTQMHTYTHAYIKYPLLLHIRSKPIVPWVLNYLFEFYFFIYIYTFFALSFKIVYWKSLSTKPWLSCLFLTQSHILIFFKIYFLMWTIF